MSMQHRFSFLHLASVIVIGLALITIFGCVTALKNGNTFTYDGVESGSIMTQDYCQFPETSVWVTVDRQGECIRYFHAGLKDNNPVVHVWFHGDRLRTVGKLTDRNVKVISYNDNSPEQLQQSVNLEYNESKIPFIRLSRPGTYGSSGEHKNRRLPKEIQIINAALNEIKSQYQIGAFILSGQSGGGHVVGSLLSLRNDIACAVITSGLVSIRKRNIIKEWRTDATGYTGYYDPVEHVDQIIQNNNRPIFIVGDPNDGNVPFSTQEYFYNELIKYGHQAWLIKSDAPDNHSLSTVGFKVVQMWFKGIPPNQIVSSLSDY